MARILILYGTDNGQTLKISKRIATGLRNTGHQVELLAGNKARKDFSLEGVDAILVGTSIHMNVHQISVKKLIRAHAEAFSRIPSAYFCVCLTAAGTDAKSQEQVRKYIDDLAHYTGWQPNKTTAFAGALAYPDYNFVKRFTAKLLARKLELDTETKDYFDYTDWNAVDRFAEEFAEMLPSADSPQNRLE